MNALITGATSEIGMAISEALARKNINIIIHYNSKEKEALNLKKSLEEKYNIKCLCIKADFKSEDEINNLIETSYKEFDNIDILINNAALDLPKLFREKTKKDFEDILNVNLIAPFLLAKQIGEKMYLNKKGKIINITSTNGIDTYFPMCLDYDASKAGLISLTHNLALQFKPYVNVNAVAPGTIATRDLEEEYQEEEKTKIFKERLGTPLDVANLVEFLVSEEADYINNQVIRVDGGMY